MRIAFTQCHGSGNDFPLIDARSLTLGEPEWAMLARLLADREGPVGGDGLLALVPGDDTHAFGMRMWNSDGSEAETCLNGLRCTARLGFDLLGLDAAQVKLKTSSASVARDPEIAPGVATIRTLVGPNSTRAADVGLVGAPEQVLDAAIDGLPNPRAFTAVAMPNPHLVTFVDRIDEAELLRIGEACEAAPAWLPNRANVSFVERRGANLFVRTFERGVGLTDSCGSAMAASTYAACLTGRIAFDAPTTVFNKGGLVRAEVARDAMVSLSGNATWEWRGTVTVDLAAERAGDLIVHGHCDAEIAAWAGLADAASR